MGDGVQFYEPVEELGGTFKGRLGKFRYFWPDSSTRLNISVRIYPVLNYFGILKDQIMNFKEHVEETHRRLDRRFTYYDNPLIDEALEKWRGWWFMVTQENSGSL